MYSTTSHASSPDGGVTIERASLPAAVDDARPGPETRGHGRRLRRVGGHGRTGTRAGTTSVSIAHRSDPTGAPSHHFAAGSCHRPSPLPRASPQPTRIPLRQHWHPYQSERSTCPGPVPPARPAIPGAASQNNPATDKRFGSSNTAHQSPIPGCDLSWRVCFFGIAALARTRGARRGCSFDLWAISGFQIEGTPASKVGVARTGSIATRTGSITEETPASNRALGPVRAIQVCLPRIVPGSRTYL